MPSPASSPTSSSRKRSRLRAVAVDGAHPRVLHGGGPARGDVGAIGRRSAGRARIRGASGGSARDHGPVGREARGRRGRGGFEEGPGRAMAERITFDRSLYLPEAVEAAAAAYAEHAQIEVTTEPTRVVAVDRPAAVSTIRTWCTRSATTSCYETIVRRRQALEEVTSGATQPDPARSRSSRRTTWDSFAGDGSRGKVLVTNDAGDWAFLSEAEFERPAWRDASSTGTRASRSCSARASCATGWISTRWRRGSPSATATCAAARTCTSSPLTSRREPSSAERAGRGSAGADMDAETAEKIVDLALQSTSPSITFELQGQGGEPLLNFDVLRHLVEMARSRNERSGRKDAALRRAQQLHRHERGDGRVADRQRRAGEHQARRTGRACTTGTASGLGGSAHADVVRWIEYFHRRYAELGRDPRQWHVDALMTHDPADAWRRGARSSTSTWRAVCEPSTCGRSMPRASMPRPGRRSATRPRSTSTSTGARSTTSSS